VHASDIESSTPLGRSPPGSSSLAPAIRGTPATPPFLLGILKDLVLRRRPECAPSTARSASASSTIVRDVGDAQVAHALEIDYLNWIDLSGKNVYVLKDVVSTGVIETYCSPSSGRSGRPR